MQLVLFGNLSFDYFSLCVIDKIIGRPSLYPIVTIRITGLLVHIFAISFVFALSQLIICNLGTSTSGVKSVILLHISSITCATPRNGSTFVTLLHSIRCIFGIFDKHETFDIDTKEDFEIGKLLYKKFNKNL